MKQYTETIGVCEEIRKPPINENVNDPDSMIRLEGQTLGKLGNEKRSWFMILSFWAIYGLPTLIGFVSWLVIMEYSTWWHYLVLIGIAFLMVIGNLPIIQAVKHKIRA